MNNEKRDKDTVPASNMTQCVLIIPSSGIMVIILQFFNNYNKRRNKERNNKK